MILKMSKTEMVEGLFPKLNEDGSPKVDSNGEPIMEKKKYEVSQSESRWFQNQEAIDAYKESEEFAANYPGKGWVEEVIE